MTLIRTDRGKEALRLRDPDLSSRARQIIVLSNGVRSRAAMGDLMERDIQAKVERLIQCGYLTEGMNARQMVPTTQGPSAAKDVPSSAKGNDQPLLLPVSRRSLAGTKMYVMDMLQLLRDMDASSMVVSIHTSEGEMDFMSNVIVAARLIAQKRGTPYAVRVLGKLREIVPEAHLPAIDALRIKLNPAT